MSSRGTTLVEMLVVIVLLGIMAGVTAVTIRVLSPGTAAASDETRIADARRRAVRSGRESVAWLGDSGGARSVLALPDGSVVGDTLADIDRFAGRLRQRRR